MTLLEDEWPTGSLDHEFNPDHMSPILDAAGGEFWLHALASQILDILCQILYAQYCMLNIVCNVFLWLFGLAPSNPGLQELNNQLRYGQYHLPMGVDGLASLA